LPMLFFELPSAAAIINSRNLALISHLQK
jgi:hypothetical protein